MCHISARVSLPGLGGPWVVSYTSAGALGKVGTLVSLPDYAQYD